MVDKKGRMASRLSPGDEDAMLSAFAYSGATADMRARGADVVRAAQQQDCWFRCDCLGAGLAPVLVPMAETHIRRSPHHPEHAEGCPFEMTPAEREGYAASLREPETGGSFQLARAIGRPDGALVRDAGAGNGAGGLEEDEDGPGMIRGLHSAYRERSKLSQLLFKLLADARVHQVGRGPRGHADQQAALYQAARGISLGGDLRLSGVLYTDAGQLDDLADRIRLRARWPDGRRPHGVLVFAAERIEDDVIVAVSGTRLTVEGPIAVFGPGKGRVRNGPFVVAVLVASPDGRAALAPLKAYAHPCWSATDILPLDSSHERRALDLLVRFQGWMAERGYTVEVTKPLYDRSRYFMGKEEPDQLVKPDFEAKVFAANSRFVRSLVVEVMGLDTPVYRAKKQRLKQILTRKAGQYLEHLAHEGFGQAEGDGQFRRGLFEFGKAVIIADKRKVAAMPPPMAVPAPPLLSTAPPEAHYAVIAPPQPARLPSQPEAPTDLLRVATPWPTAAEAGPTATMAEPASRLGWLARRLLMVLRGGR